MAAEQIGNLSKAYPMNGGHGLYSYTKNSTYQGAAIGAVRQFINETIAEKLDIDILSSNNFRVTDLGCSVGPNTFVAVQNILEAVQNKYQCQGQDSGFPEFQVFLNDHVFNDFNTLFASLPSNRQYYAVGVPGSFYGRLFPSASLQIVHTSYALHWLSQVPKEVLDSSSPAWNKGRIHYSCAGAQTIKAYTDQFTKDMDLFLHSRAQEVVCGGLVILTVPGRLNGIPHSQAFWNFTFDLLGSSLIGMAKKGIISEEKVDSFNIPVYFPTPQELEAAVERNGCFSIERLECITQEKTQGSISSKARAVSYHVRAGLEVLLKGHFGHEIMDELFDLYNKEVEKSSIFEKGIGYSLFVVLKRKAIDQQKIQSVVYNYATLMASCFLSFVMERLSTWHDLSQICKPFILISDGNTYLCNSGHENK